jgi:hypothetical protein
MGERGWADIGTAGERGGGAREWGEGGRPRAAERKVLWPRPGRPRPRSLSFQKCTPARPSTRATQAPAAHRHPRTRPMATTAPPPPPPPPTARVALASRADVAKLHQLLTTTSRRALRVRDRRELREGTDSGLLFPRCMQCRASPACLCARLGREPPTAFLGGGAAPGAIQFGARLHAPSSGCSHASLTPLSLSLPTQASLQDAPEAERKAAEKSLQTSVVRVEKGAGERRRQRATRPPPRSLAPPNSTLPSHLSPSSFTNTGRHHGPPAPVHHL